MGSAIKIGTKGEKKVSELVNEKGCIFSLIKEGYMFDDEVLNAANITHIIRDVHFENVVFEKNTEKNENLKKDSVSAKQIISELNSINKGFGDFKDEYGDNYENQIDSIKFEDNDE